MAGAIDQTGLPAAVAPFRVVRGACRLFFAFDIGFAIDLDAARGLLAGHGWSMKPGEAGASDARSPRYHPRPLRAQRPCESVALGAWRAGPVLGATLFDFGAVSICLDIDIAGADLASLASLSALLYENSALRAHARRGVEEILRQILPAVSKPGLEDFVEDYIVYEVSSHEGLGPEAGAALRGVGGPLARVLRAREEEPSAQEIEDALAARLSYTPRDAAVIDWNAALVLDPRPEEVTAVLELANIELLERRHLDQRLDALVAEAYGALGGPGPAQATGRELARIGRLQADAVTLFEGVTNSLKLIGDQYLARVYRAAGQRFHLPQWDAVIVRKLAAVEGIYEKLSDRRANRRMETLEWIIIALIALGLVMPFLEGLLRSKGP